MNFKKSSNFSIILFLLIISLGIFPADLVKAESNPYDILSAGGSLLNGLDTVGDSIPNPNPCDEIGGTADGCLSYGPITNELKKIDRKAATKITFDSVLNTIVLPALSSAAKIAARRLISQISEKTVDWINGKSGDRPAYVSDFGKFSAETANEAAGDIIANDPALNFVLNLPSFQTFKQQVTCTFTDAEKNLLEATNNPDGMWSAWLDIAQNPQNTALGAYLISQEQINNKVQKKITNIANDLLGSGGALSLKHCYKYTYTDGQSDVPDDLGTSFKDLSYDHTDNGNGDQIECETTTPGSVITDTLGFQSTSDARMNELVGALGDGIDNVLGALANQVIKNVESRISDGVLGSKNLHVSEQLDAIDANNQAYYARLKDQINQNTNNTSTTVTSDQKDLIDSIDAKGNLEAQLLANLSAASIPLQKALPIFTNDGVSCNYNFHNVSAAQQITANVVNNIQGLNDSSRVVPDLKWNLMTIQTAIGTVNQNIAILNQAKVDALATTSPDALSEISDKLDRTIFPYTLDTLVSDTYSWLGSMEASYTSNKCPIILTGKI